MKKTLIFLLVSACAFALCACSDDDERDEAAPTNEITLPARVGEQGDDAD